MYINEIYSILDETLNKIFSLWINNKNEDDILMSFSKIAYEKNFKKYQKELNVIFEYLFTLIDQSKIKNLVKKNSNIDLINSVIEKYMAYYIFFFIGLLYKNELNDFNNNIIEISREQTNYKLVISDFFTSESNSITI